MQAFSSCIRRLGTSKSHLAARTVARRGSPSSRYDVCVDTWCFAISAPEIASVAGRAMPLRPYRPWDCLLPRQIARGATTVRPRDVEPKRAQTSFKD